MRNFLIYSVIFVFCSIILYSFVAHKYKRIQIGDKSSMIDEKMESTDGNKYSLQDLKEENGIVVIFSANTCPFVVGSSKWDGWSGRYNKVYKQAKKNKIGMIVINSNEAKRSSKDSEDSLEEMIKLSKNESYKFKYVVDKDSKLANSYGANTTPDVFLFDKDFNLVYTGAIDDNYKSHEKVKKGYLFKAIKQLANGKKIKKQVTKNIGCSIKRN